MAFSSISMIALILIPIEISCAVIPSDEQSASPITTYDVAPKSSTGEICIRVPSGEPGGQKTVCGPKINEDSPTTVQQSSVSVDKQRSSVFPISDGYGYYTIGQVANGVPHFPQGPLYPQYAMPDLPPQGSGSRQSDDEDIESARKHWLYNKKKGYPIYYSQPQYVPYNYNNYNSLYSPYYSGYHGPFLRSENVTADSYASRSSEEPTKPVVALNMAQPYLTKMDIQPSHQSSSVPIATRPVVQPSVHYSTQYVVENPAQVSTSQSQILTQAPPQVMPTVSRIPVTLQCEIKPPSVMPSFDLQRSSDPGSESSAIFTQIPGMSHFAEAGKSQPTMVFGYPGLQIPSFQNGGSFKSSNPDSSMYPNYMQQMINAQIQHYYKELLKNAAEIEKRANEMSERKTYPTESTNRNAEELALKDDINYLTQQLGSKFESLRQSEERLGQLHTQLKNGPNSTNDQEKKTNLVQRAAKSEGDDITKSSSQTLKSPESKSKEPFELSESSKSRILGALFSKPTPQQNEFPVNGGKP